MSWPASISGVGDDEAGSVGIASWIQLLLQEGTAAATVKKHGVRDATHRIRKLTAQENLNQGPPIPVLGLFLQYPRLDLTNLQQWDTTVD